MTKGEVEQLPEIEFCRIDENELETTEDYVKYLWSAIYNPNCYYSDFDNDIHLMEGKRNVDYVGNLRIVIQLKEHPPPHFEVIIDNSKACLNSVRGKFDLTS